MKWHERPDSYYADLQSAEYWAERRRHPDPPRPLVIPTLRRELIAACGGDDELNRMEDEAQAFVAIRNHERAIETRDREGVYRQTLRCVDCGLITERDVWGSEGEASECPGEDCGSVEVERV